MKSNKDKYWGKQILISEETNLFYITYHNAIVLHAFEKSILLFLGWEA